MTNARRDFSSCHRLSTFRFRSLGGYCLPVLVASFGKGNISGQTLTAIQGTNISGLNKLFIKPRVVILSY